MNITIIGAGNMAKGIGTRLVTGGHRVTIHARNEAKGAALAEELSAAAKNGGSAQYVALGSDIQDDIVILAVHFGAEMESIVKVYGVQLANKTVIDICNPLEFPSFEWLIDPSATSGAEIVAELLPQSKIVKAFSTQLASVLVTGEAGGQSLDILVAGDDGEAKNSVLEMIRSTDMRPIDMGVLANSRPIEAINRLVLQVQDQFDTPWATALKIVG